MLPPIYKQIQDAVVAPKQPVISYAAATPIAVQKPPALTAFTPTAPIAAPAPSRAITDALQQMQAKPAAATYNKISDTPEDIARRSVVLQATHLGSSPTAIPSASQAAATISKSISAAKPSGLSSYTAAPVVKPTAAAAVAAEAQRKIDAAARVAANTFKVKPASPVQQYIKDTAVEASKEYVPLPSSANDWDGTPLPDPTSVPFPSAKSSPAPQSDAIGPDEDALTDEIPTATPTAITVVKKDMGLWDRFLSFLGLQKVAPSSKIHGEPGLSPSSIQGAAESVVRRVRSGDQNAMALMALVRDNAAAGMPQAKISWLYMKRYIETHPVNGMRAQMGSEYDEGIKWELG